MPDLNGGGAERVVLTVSRYLAREWFDPSIFLLRNAGVYWDEIPGDMRVEYGVSRPGPLKHRAFSILKKLQLEAARNHVVIGALELLPSYFAYVAGSLRRKPVIGWVHTDLERHLSACGGNWIHRRVMECLYPMFRNVVLPSRSASDTFLGAVPVEPSRTKVIYNPLDSSLVRCKASESPPEWADAIFRKSTVIALGRLHVAQKGFDKLIEAHAKLVPQGMDHNLLILGDGQDREALERLAQRLNVGRSVHLPGFQQNPYPLIARARALVVSSRYEAFGMVVLEAMELGVPVIALNSARGPFEILEGGAYGMCVPDKSPAALASAMNDIVSNSVLYHRYASLGRKRVESFQPEKIICQWKELIWSAAQSSSH
jgi:glycosyltransferase involved in cell wall biosynthesis